MSKKKKIILITAIIILVFAMIMGGIFWITHKNKMESNESNSKINKLYSELEQKKTFSFAMTLDNENKIYYAKKDNKAYIETIYQGERSKFIIKDGNSYLLMEDEKIYYTYQNNQTDLERIMFALAEIKDKKFIEGKEKIDGKEYKYNEYEGTTGFVINNVPTVESETTKTRFYFNKDKLSYIKTIMGEYQELLKIEILYKVDDKLFEIPSDYVEK